MEVSSSSSRLTAFIDHPQDSHPLCRSRGIYNIFIGISIYSIFHSKFSSHFQILFLSHSLSIFVVFEIGFNHKKIRVLFLFLARKKKEFLCIKKIFFFLLHHTAHTKKIWLIIMAPKSIKSTFQYVTKISREDPGLIRRILVDDFFGAIIFFFFFF